MIAPQLSDVTYPITFEIGQYYRGPIKKLEKDDSVESIATAKMR